MHLHRQKAEEDYLPELFSGQHSEESKAIAEQLLERIEVNPQIMMGKPVIKGPRIPVDIILRKLAHSIAVEELLRDYPRLTEEDIKAAVLYAAEMLESTLTYDLTEA